jgi:hypothetical protein
MKTIMAALLTILISGMNYDNYARQDDRAGNILDQVFEKIKSSPSVSIDFTVAISNPRENFSDEFDGGIVMKGEKYRLDFMDTETWFDGNSTYTLLSDANEVMISDPDEADGGIMSNPAGLFTDYRKEFKYRFIGEVTREGRRLYEIELHPIEPDQLFHTVKLYVDRDRNFVHTAVIAGKDGNNYTLKVKTFDTTKQVPESYFVFRKEDYPGVEIIDMRW